MSGFWSSQLDYVFLVYGLSFVLMAVQCLVVRRHDRSTPWGLLAAFGIIHGINEWLDMLAISLPDTPVFKGARLVVMAASFIALVEFGRRGLERDGRPLVGRWLTPTLLGLAALGALPGDMNGLNAACRYALGFPGALMTAAALWRVSRSCAGSQRYGLGLASLSLLVYSLAAGLVVPRAAFSPAAWLNHDAFYAAVGFPVQLVRMLCAFTAMAGFWIRGSHAEFSTEQIGFIRRWSYPMALVLLLVMGWFAADSRAKSTDADMRRRLIDQAVRIAEAANPELVKALSFTAADKDNPAFQRLRGQMIAYSQSIALRSDATTQCLSIYSMILRDGAIIFGPESIDENDSRASKPGTVYEEPPAGLHSLFHTGPAFTDGPRTDEYGTFISAFASARDPRTGKVLMVVGLDILAGDYKAQVAAARLLPIIGALVLILITLGGTGTIYWRNALTADKQPRFRLLEPVLVATAGLTLTVMLSLVTLESDNRERGRVFQEFAQAHAENTRACFGSVRSDVAALGRLFEASQNVERGEFHTYAGPMVETGATQGCAWVQCVTAAQRAGVEAQARRDGIGSFAIRQNDARGNRVPVSPRAKYYPVIYIEPRDTLKAVLGFDEASEPTRRAALERAIRTGFTTATDSIRVVGEADGQQSLLVFHPIFTKQDLADGGRQLRGFAASMVRYQTLLDHAVGESAGTPGMVETCLVDLMSAGRPRVLAVTPREAVVNHRLMDESYLGQYNLVDTSPIFAFGRTYAVFSHPTPAFFAAYPARDHTVTGAAGLVITVLLSLLAGFIHNRQAFLEREVRERTSELRESEENLNREASMRGILLENLACTALILEKGTRTIVYSNKAARDAGAFAGTTCHETCAKLDQPCSFCLAPEAWATGESRRLEVEQGGRHYEGIWVPLNHDLYAHYIYDITEHKQAERCQHLSAEILDILNEPVALADAINRVLAAIKRETGFDAVGLRLKNGDDFPYFAQNGFCDDFLLAENALVVPDKEGGVCRDEDGKISLECTCGLVLSGQTDPANPLFTPGGSCWTNNSFPLLDLPADQDSRLHPRNRCIHEGFLSVALIPIHANQEIVGLLQLNDRREDRLSLDMIRYFEDLSASIGLALMKKQAEEALRASNAKLGLALTSSGMGVWQWDIIEDKRIFDNQTCSLLGIDPTTFSGTAEEFIAAVHPDDRKQVEENLAQATERDVPYAPEYRAVWPDGSVHYICSRGSVVQDKMGRPARVTGVIWDITKRKQVEELLQNERDNLAAIFTSSPIGMLLLDEETMIVDANSVIASMVSRNPGTIVGRRGGGGLGCIHSLESEKGCGFATVCPGCSLRQGIMQVLRDGTSIRGAEIRTTLLINGQEHNPWLRVSAEPVTISGRKHVVVALDDITDRKQAEEALREAHAEIDAVNRQLVNALTQANQLANEAEQAKEQIEEKSVELGHQATHDALTGLPNRRYFEQHLHNLITGSTGRKSRSLAVLFLDLDRFKLINDTLGHKLGDLLLVEVAKRLQSCLRTGDVLARMGGDEFTVILPRCQSRSVAESVASRMIDSVGRQFEIQGHRFVIGVSIGLARHPSDAADAGTLIKYADAAMYKAKELGRNSCQFFSEEISQANEARTEIEHDLRLAIERDELRVYYQPIIDIRTMRLAGAEALLRWNHPDKGMISPGLFMPVAEETGLIVQMGKTVLETACKQCVRWQEAGYTGLDMSVNVSPIQLRDMAFTSEVDSALSQAGLPAHYLRLEVIETALARNDNDELDVLRFLRALGVSICIDDFGIGYSSLSRLNSFPIDHLKIDGHFIRNIENNKKDKAMAESIIVMAHNLGMQVTAEWVEDDAQLRTIKSLDCDYAQGYLVSPALSPCEFEDFVRDWAFAQQTADAA